MNFKGRVKWFLQGSAHYITMWIGYRYAKSLPMYFVVGFPRSGTSWLSEMLADYYNLPRPRHYYLPIAFAAVIHTHFKPNAKFKNTYYVYRDGRDSYTSSYYKTLKLIETDPLYVKKDFYIKLFNGKVKDLSIDDHRHNMYAFLLDQFNSGHIWSTHIDNWKKAAKSNQDISFLSFENLLADPESELADAIRKLDNSADDEIIKQVIFRNSFSQQIRRPKAQHRTVLRKGKKNSWQEIFNQETRILFDKYCGDMLLELGYENNRDWINKDHNS